VRSNGIGGCCRGFSYPVDLPLFLKPIEYVTSGAVYDSQERPWSPILARPSLCCVLEAHIKPSMKFFLLALNAAAVVGTISHHDDLSSPTRGESMARELSGSTTTTSHVTFLRSIITHSHAS